MMDSESLGERTRLVHWTPSYEAYNGKVICSYLFRILCNSHMSCAYTCDYITHLTKFTNHLEVHLRKAAS